MFCLVDCNNFWSPSGGGVRRYHLEKIKYYTHQDTVKYVFVMHDDSTYTEQLNETTFITHLKVPKVAGNWEYRYLVRSKPLAPILQEFRPDVIEVGSPYLMPGIIRRLTRRLQIPSRVYGFWHADFPVTYLRRFAPHPLKNPIEGAGWWHARRHYNRMSGTLVASRHIKDRMEMNGIRNVHYVPLGVDQEQFQVGFRDEGLVSELRAGEPTRPILFFPHRFSHEKGLHLLLAAYPKLKKLLDIEPALVFAGMGPYQYKVEEAARTYPHVHFIGFVEDNHTLARYYASSDVGFALSPWETFGLSILEAMHCGLPLISANDGAAREHVLASEAGLVVEKMDADHLSEGIFTLLKSPAHEAMRMKAISYASNFNWSNSFDRQLKIYQNIEK